MMVLVVAGGRSRRFGRDKRLFAAPDAPLLVRSVETVRTLGLPVVLALGASPGQIPWPEGVAVWLDRDPGAGPMPVVLDALARRDEDLLCVAADLHGLRPSVLTPLLTAAERSLADVVVYAGAEGFEPLCAVYLQRCRVWLDRAAQQGERSLQHALRAHADRVQAIPLPLDVWKNLNEPGDRA